MAKKLRTRPPGWIENAPVKVGVAREFATTPDEVFEALCDHESWPDWFEAIERVERLGDQREGVGSRRRVHINKRFSVDEEFIVWEPGKAWGFTVYEASIGGLRTLNELVQIQAIADDRTRVTYTMGFDPNPVVGVLMKVGAKAVMRKKLGTALDSLGIHIAEKRRG